MTTGPALLLFPGAGTGSDHPSLRAIEAASPWPTVRADFVYRKAGRRSPDRPAVLIQAVVDEAEKIASPFLVLGGRSMGGRICSIAVAQGLVTAAGLVLISYRCTRRESVTNSASTTSPPSMFRVSSYRERVTRSDPARSSRRTRPRSRVP